MNHNWNSIVFTIHSIVFLCQKKILVVHICAVSLYVYFLLHKLWVWCQICWIYRSVLLISGSFECRKVFLSPIWAASWRSTARSDPGKKSAAFHCSQKWLSKVGCQEKTIRTWASGLGGVTNDQSKIVRLTALNNWTSTDKMGEQQVLEEAQAELNKRVKALADPAALAMKATRWHSISKNCFPP